MMDLVASLGWVRDNIESCGGDPAKGCVASTVFEPFRHLVKVLEGPSQLRTSAKT
jgi:hypothetical protein